MHHIDLHQTDLTKKNGFGYFRNLLSQDLFEGMEDELRHIINGQYSSGGEPLRSWWMDEEHHFKKIDQVHHCSELIYSFIKKAELENILKNLFSGNVIQVWASSLYLCPPDDGQHSSVVGYHSDSQFTAFIEGDYYTAWIPLNKIDENNISVFEGSHNIDINEKILNPMEQNIFDKKQYIKSCYDMKESSISVSSGDVFFAHSKCVRGVLPNLTMNSNKYLVVYFREEGNHRRKNIDDFGMCKYLDDLVISPVVWLS